MSEFDTRMIDALAADGVKPFDLNEVFEKLHSLFLERNKATKTLRTQIMDLEKQMEAISEPYDQQIADLQAKIAEEVKFTGKSFKYVIPEGSEVVILDEDEKSFRVSIARAHISFNISKTNAEVVES